MFLFLFNRPDVPAQLRASQDFGRPDTGGYKATDESFG